MSDSRGYNLTASVRERLRLLDWITENGGSGPGTFVSLGPLLTEDDDTARTVAGHLDGLEAARLIRLQKTMGWEGWSCDVTPSGVAYRDDMEAARGDLMERRKQCRDAFLEWLNTEALRGTRAPVISAFSSSPYGTFFGQPFSEQEVNAASNWLKDEGYLKGSGSFGGGVIRPQITTKGEKTVEAGRSVNAAETPAPFSQTTVNITGHGNNVAANSTGVSQSTTVTMDEKAAHEVNSLAEALAQMLNADQLKLDDAGNAEAAEVVEALRAVATRDDVPGTELDTLFTRAKTVALSGTGTVMGQMFVTAVQGVATALGLA